MGLLPINKKEDRDRAIPSPQGVVVNVLTISSDSLSLSFYTHRATILSNNNNKMGTRQYLPSPQVVNVSLRLFTHIATILSASFHGQGFG